MKSTLLFSLIFMLVVTQLLAAPRRTKKKESEEDSSSSEHKHGDHHGEGGGGGEGGQVDEELMKAASEPDCQACLKKHGKALQQAANAQDTGKMMDLLEKLRTEGCKNMVELMEKKAQAMG